MKLVGATNWFVRGPFMIEGLLCGLGGAFARGVPARDRQGGRAAGDPAQRALDRAPTCTRSRSRCTALILLGIGLGLGALGSGLTVRRFLRV